MLIQLAYSLNSWMSIKGLGKEAEHVLKGPERLGHSWKMECLKEPQ